MSVNLKPNKNQANTKPAGEEYFYQTKMDGALVKQQTVLKVDNDCDFSFVFIPAGKITNSQIGQSVTYPNGFWMGQFEITNEQFAQFGPNHDSNLEHGDFLQFSKKGRGWPLNLATQPVVRISWEKALDFCLWLSEKTGKQIGLPTVEQWFYANNIENVEWENDFSPFANLADVSLSNLDSYEFEHPYIVLGPWRPSIRSINDGYRVSAPVGSYKPNKLGLYDMAGNVAEWTDSRGDKLKAAVGGSWYDRPKQALGTHVQMYYPWQGVYNVGFRVVFSD